MTIISWNHDSSNTDVTDAGNVDDDSNADVIKEHCLEKHIILIKSGSFLDKDPILTVGEHVFPFDLKVPCDLPYSFEGRYGKVKYDCVGIIEKSSSGFKMSEKMTSKRQDISIMSGLDLNLIPEASYNIEICKRKELGVCCSKGSVTIDWLVDKSGFLPADSISIEGSIQNDSKQMVAHSSVSLVMVVDCKHKNRRLVDRVRVAHKNGSPVMADDVALWNDVIVVPQCHPSSLDRCKMIEVSYELEFKVSLSANSLLQASTNNAAVNNSTYNSNNNTPYQTIVYNKTIYIGTIPLTTYHHPRPTQSQYAPLPITYPLHTTALVAVQPLPMQALQPTAILIPYYSNALNYGPGSMLAPIHGGAGVVASSPARSVDLMQMQNNYYGVYPPGSSAVKGHSIATNSNNNSVVKVNTDCVQPLPSDLEARPPPYAPGHLDPQSSQSAAPQSSPSSQPPSSSQPPTSSQPTSSQPPLSSQPPSQSQPPLPSQPAPSSLSLISLQPSSSQPPPSSSQQSSFLPVAVPPSPSPPHQIQVTTVPIISTFSLASPSSSSSSPSSPLSSQLPVTSQPTASSPLSSSAPALPPSSTPPPPSSSSYLSPPSNDDSVMRVNVEEPHASNPSKEETDDDDDDDNDVVGGGGDSGNNNKNIIDDKYSSDNSNFEANNANNETDNNNNSNNDNNNNNNNSNNDNNNNSNNNNNNNNDNNNKSGVDNKGNIGDNLKFTLQVIELKKNTVKTEKHGPYDQDETSEIDLISINSLCTDPHSTNDRASAPGLMTLLR